MTSQDIIDKARLIIGDAQKAYWSDEELSRYLEDGIRELAKLTGLFHRNSVISTSPDQSVYSIDDEVYKILEVYDQTNDTVMTKKAYSLEAERLRDSSVVLIDSFNKLVFPDPGSRSIAVRYSYIPKSFGDGWVVFDLDQDNIDDQVTYDFDGDGTQDRLYWISDGSPAGIMPDYALESLVDYVVAQAYLVDRAEQNQQKASYFLSRFRLNANKLAELAFGSYGVENQTEYQGF